MVGCGKRVWFMHASRLGSAQRAWGWWGVGKEYTAVTRFMWAFVEWCCIVYCEDKRRKSPCKTILRWEQQKSLSEIRMAVDGVVTGVYKVSSSKLLSMYAVQRRRLKGRIKKGNWRSTDRIQCHQDCCGLTPAGGSVAHSSMLSPSLEVRRK